MDNINNVLVVGTGLIGTSIAMGLRAANFEVFLEDPQGVALTIACDKSGAKPISPEINIDLVIVATPPQVVAEVVRTMSQRYPEAVITDVASVKGSIFDALAGMGESELSRIVGGHPMAGREVSGASAAQSNLFVDRPWVIIRNEQTSDSACEVVRKIALTLGAVPIERTSIEHDQAVALVSHTPQIVASVLAAQLVDAPDSYVQLAGQGIRDATRIAGSDADLWTEILKGNSQYVAKYVDAIAGKLREVAEALNTKNDSSIHDVLTQGAVGRNRLPGKHGMTAPLTAVVEVRLEDKPGELARLFAVAARANVNLEDVRIDHSLGRMTGLVELTVAEPSAVPLKEALMNDGFIVVA